MCLKQGRELYSAAWVITVSTKCWIFNNIWQAEYCNLTWTILKFQYWTYRILNLKDLTSGMLKFHDRWTYVTLRHWSHVACVDTLDKTNCKLRFLRLWISYLSKQVPEQVNSYLTTVLTVFGVCFPSLPQWIPPSDTVPSDTSAIFPLLRGWPGR